jgi:type IV pilus assembly protein PilN
MLRINLLPIRQLKKRAKARNQIIGFGMIFCAVLLALGFIGLIQVGKVENVQAAIAKLQQEQSELDPIIRKVDELERQKIDLQNKIDIIKKLRRESSLTVRVLDEVAKIIDNDRMWLTTLSQDGASLQLKGIALDNETIAQFMEALKESEYIGAVNLDSSTLNKVANRDFKSFGLTCSVGFPAEEPATGVAKQ